MTSAQVVETLVSWISSNIPFQEYSLSQTITLDRIHTLTLDVHGAKTRVYPFLSVLFNGVDYMPVFDHIQKLTPCGEWSVQGQNSRGHRLGEG